MKKQILILISLVYLGIYLPLNAQKIDYSVFIGGNYNFLTQKCDYDIADKNGVKPAISYSLGGYARTNYKKIHLLSFIEYSRINNKISQTFRVPDGNFIGESTSGINNHYLLLSILSTFKIGKGFYLGGGLSVGYLFWSSLKTEETLYKYKLDSYGFVRGDAIGKVFTNHNFKRNTFSIPIIVGYDIERINIFTRLNVGVMNRIKGDSFVREIENPLVFGIGYRLTKYE